MNIDLVKLKELFSHENYFDGPSVIRIIKDYCKQNKSEQKESAVDAKREIELLGVLEYITSLVRDDVNKKMRNHD